MSEPSTTISPAEAVNARPYDLDKQAIDDLFDEAANWLDGSAIENDAQAEGFEKLLKLTREARKTAENNRRVENKPFDDGKAEVQARYNPLLARADLIAENITAVLTPWRNKLAQQQREEAERVRRAAEEASRMAQHVAEVAGSNIGAQEIAAGAEDTARRMQKTADRLTKNAGKGLKMRTVWDHEIDDLKAALNALYKTDRAGLEEYVSDRMRSLVKQGGVPSFPGVKFTERKEAF